MTPPLERMVVSLYVPADVTADEVRAALEQHVRAVAVAVYPPPPHQRPPRCSPHLAEATAFTDGAWRCARCLIEGSAPEGRSDG